MDSRLERIKLLSRLNREKSTTPALLRTLSEVLGIPVEESSVLDPVRTDALSTEFRTGYSDAKERGSSLSYSRFFDRNQLASVISIAEGLAQQLKAEDVFLLTKFEGDPRGLVLNAADVFSRADSVIQFDGDSLSVLSKDHSQGVLIDHNPDDSEQTYEMTVWGDRWPLVVLARDRGFPQR